MNDELVVEPLEFVDSSLPRDERMCYWVRPIDKSGKQPELPRTYQDWDEAISCTYGWDPPIGGSPPGPPLSLSVTGNYDECGEFVATLNWTGTTVLATDLGDEPFANPENPQPDELVGYVVYMGNAGSVAGPPFDALKTVSDLSPYWATDAEERLQFQAAITEDYDGAPLEREKEYCFRVYSLNSSISFFESGEEVCLRPKDHSKPEAPTLNEPVCEAGACQLSWIEPQSSDSLSFEIWRCSLANADCIEPSDFERIDETQIWGTTFLDDETEENAQYAWCVASVDATDASSDLPCEIMDSTASCKTSYVPVACEGDPANAPRFRIDAGWRTASFPVKPDGVTGQISVVNDLAGLNAIQLDGSEYAPAETAGARPAAGYWVYSPASTYLSACGAAYGADETVEANLQTGWNFLGNPFQSVLPWGDNISIACDGATKNLSEAAAAGWTDGVAWTYDSDAQSYAQPGAIPAWSGFFFKLTNSSDCSIQLGL